MHVFWEFPEITASEARDRLADGTYGTDEVTGEPIADEVLENDPTARRA